MPRPINYSATAIAGDISAITGNDSTDNAPDGCFGFYATTAGNVVITTAFGTQRTVPVTANSYHYLAFKRFWLTGSTATIMALAF